MRSDLPVHFFTIVLNGEPFIEYHLDVFKALPFRWHWHIVEGVAELKHDTAWSLAAGGRIPGDLHLRGRSNDGTSEYLDRIAAEAPANVTIYRKPLDRFWDGKKEMVSAPLPNIREECLLWQVDSDELWTASQVSAVRDLFLADASRTAAFFWCSYFVGPEAVITTRNNYAQNPSFEWLRVWRYRPGDRWLTHEPPRLARRPWYRFRPVDLAQVAPIRHDATEAVGAVFQHMAYVTEAQLRFKETYYGYAGAVSGWKRLNDAVKSMGAVRLGDYLPWVTDQTRADSVANAKVRPMAVYDRATSRWRFDRDT